MNNQTNRIPSLDGLRAISIALVIFDHFFTNLGLPINTFIFGNLGVRVFFIISGFLITTILLAELEKTSAINLKKFYFRRILRIFPAYYFYILVVLIFAVLGFYQTSLFNLIVPIMYVSNYIPPGIEELVHTWSLSVEEQFYLLFPCILLVFRISKTKKYLLFVLLIAPVIRILNINAVQTTEEFDIPRWFLFGFHTNMDVLASGCLLALYRNALHKNKHYKKFLHSSAPFLSLLFIICFVASNSAYSFAFFGIGLTVINLSITLCVDWLITNHQNTIGQILNSSPFVFVGMMSYSLYLWQQPFSKYTEELIWTHYSLNIILMIGFSLFSYYFIERKFLRWRQIWENHLFVEKPKKTVLRTNVC